MRGWRVGRFLPVIALAISCSSGPGAPGPGASKPTPISGPAVTGTAVDSSGRIEAGATVVLSVVLTQAEQDERAQVEEGSLGFACIKPGDCTAPSTTGQTAGDGAFEVAMPTGVYAATDPIAVTVVAQRGESARVATTVQVPRPQGRPRLDAGRIPIAAATPTLRRTPTSNRLVMPRTVAHVDSVTVTMSRADRADDPFVPKPPTMDVSAGYDPRMAEDSLVLLDGRQSGSDGVRSYELSASLVVPGGAVPPSRGSDCYLKGSRGERSTQRPCRLTDGDLDRPWKPGDDPPCTTNPCRGLQLRDVTVVLPRPVRVHLIVVRGCGDTCRVAISTDGRSFGAWHDAGQSGPDEVFVLGPGLLPTGVPIRAVRVETAGGGFFYGLREVSVFG
jgi:hypothetical protein